MTLTGQLTLDHLLDKTIGLLYMRGGFIWPYDANVQGNMMGGFAPSWFLNCLFLAFIIYLGYDRCKHKKLYASTIFILTIATYKIPFLPPWSADISLIAFLFMLIGNKLKTLYFDTSLNTKSIAWFLLALAVFIPVATCNGFVCMIFRNYGTQGYLSIPLLLIEGTLYTLIFTRLCQWFEQTKLVHACAYVGRQSLRLLCIHMPIYVYTYAIILHTPYLSTLPDGVQAPFYLAELLLVNAILDWMLKKYHPKHQWLKYL